MTDIYDDPKFFNAYAQMARSQKGLSAAGEWPTFQKLLPDLKGKRVLDLGCGYGWHCRYAAQQGAKSVLGVDLSEKMLAKAQSMTKADNIRYQQGDLQTFTSDSSFDVVLSSLALHYVQDLKVVYQNVFACLKSGGFFQFTMEHPIYTAEGHERWLAGPHDEPLFWPVDHYFDEGSRTTSFLDQPVKKYHHTIETILQGLLDAGFVLQGVKEPQPAPALRKLPEMQTSMRVPMMLIVKAQKPAQ